MAQNWSIYLLTIEKLSKNNASIKLQNNIVWARAEETINLQERKREKGKSANASIY